MDVTPVDFDQAMRDGGVDLAFVFGMRPPRPARPLDGFLALVRAQERGIVDKLPFGSDYPMWMPKEAADGLRVLAATSTGLPSVHESTLERILHGNPLADLGLSA